MEYLTQQPTNSVDKLRVVLSYAPLGFVQAQPESIAHDRIEVNTGSITLNQNAEVEIVFRIPGTKVGEHHRIAAQVIHCDQHGKTTLGFLCCGERTMQALLPYLSVH